MTVKRRGHFGVDPGKRINVKVTDVQTLMTPALFGAMVPKVTVFGRLQGRFEKDGTVIPRRSLVYFLAEHVEPPMY